tara:strand:- start:94661 stop:95146 length:486 start_codon:yes stop_codon:yes gene_type:complete
VSNQININDYQPLIHSITNKFGPEYKEDLFQECYIQLHLLKDKFNSSKGNFQTYAYKRLFFTCVDYISANNLNHQSLDEVVKNEDGDDYRLSDLLPDDFNLEESITNQDYLNQHSKQLTDVESFIQHKYYNEGVSVKKIITVYQAFHQINSESTIYKILKK